MSGTETIAIVLFNAGYPLEDVVVKIRGLDDTNQHEVFAIRREIGLFPRGRTLTVEVPSYELPAPACAIAVTVVSGRYGSGA